MAFVKPSKEQFAFDIESKLVAHYLSTSGPDGSASLTHIDASRTELAECFGLANPEAAVALVCEACGTGLDVYEFLAFGTYPNGMPDEVPGFFRFLLLTCVVVASADENKETREFGKNLQRLLSTTRVFGHRQALPRMWERLASWSAQRRRDGLPIRQVVLPPFDRSEPYIGLTNAISFPSWRDTHRLRSLFEGSSERYLLATPRDVALRLCPVIRGDDRFSLQMRTASEEFDTLHRNRASLLHSHRFWGAVCRGLELKRPRNAAPDQGFRAELVVGAVSEDTRIFFFREQIAELDGRKHAIESCLVCDALKTLEKLEDEGLRREGELLQALRAGALPFAQERFGVWIANMSGGIADDEWTYLVRDDRTNSLRRLAFVKISPLTGGWSLIEPVMGSSAIHIHKALGLYGGKALDHGATIRVRGGVRTLGGFLGRPALLPWIEMDGTAKIRVSPSDGAINVRIERLEGKAVLKSDVSLEGRFEISFEDHLNGRRILAMHRAIRFVDHAPEHPMIGRASASWYDKVECSDKAWIDAPIEVAIAASDDRWRDSTREMRFDDLLEVIYARGASGWAERELIDVVRELTPGPSPWEILRTLQESGWLQAKASLRWRASLWCLVAPSLSTIRVDDSDAVLLCGSASAVVRSRFESTVLSMGGTVRFIQGVGAFSPLTAIALGVSAEHLTEELAWPIAALRSAARLRGTGWWSVVPAGIEKHQVHAAWNWSASEFRPCAVKAPVEDIEVRWWRRIEMDRADLYSVDGGEPIQFVSPSRSVALCEAFRRARRAMFAERGGLLERLSADGHLPLHLSRTLHAYALMSPGVVPCGTGWGYAYPSSDLGMSTVRACLGRHFVQSDATATKRMDLYDSSHIGVLRHRIGRTMRSLVS